MRHTCARLTQAAPKLCRDARCAAAESATMNALLSSTCVLTCVLWSAPAPAQADAAAVASARDCVLVLGQGRNAGDMATDSLWDGINVSFNAQVAATLADAGERVVALVAHVAAGDVAANLRVALQRAAVAGCRRLVETTIYADGDSHALVARLRGYPLIDQTTSDGGALTLRVGASNYDNQRQFELDRSTLDRVRPAVLGAEMAAEWLRHTIAGHALPRGR
jgi:hypothetical protein